MSYYAITIFKGWDMPPTIVALIYQVCIVQHLQESLDSDKLIVFMQITRHFPLFPVLMFCISIISAHDNNGLCLLPVCDVADEHSTSVHCCASNKCWCSGIAWFLEVIPCVSNGNHTFLCFLFVVTTLPVGNGSLPHNALPPSLPALPCPRRSRQQPSSDNSRSYLVFRTLPCVPIIWILRWQTKQRPSTWTTRPYHNPIE